MCEMCIRFVLNAFMKKRGHWICLSVSAFESFNLQPLKHILNNGFFDIKFALWYVSFDLNKAVPHLTWKVYELTGQNKSLLLAWMYIRVFLWSCSLIYMYSRIIIGMLIKSGKILVNDNIYIKMCKKSYRHTFVYMMRMKLLQISVTWSVSRMSKFWPRRMIRRWSEKFRYVTMVTGCQSSGRGGWSGGGQRGSGMLPW